MGEKRGSVDCSLTNSRTRRSKNFKLGWGLGLSLKVDRGENQALVRAIHFVVSTLTLSLMINFDQPIKWMEFQKLAEIKWLPVNL